MSSAPYRESMLDTNVLVAAFATAARHRPDRPLSTAPTRRATTAGTCGVGGEHAHAQSPPPARQGTGAYTQPTPIESLILKFLS